MSVLIVGISHRSAPVAVLERLALGSDGAAKLLRDVQDNPHVSEATVLATCNRCEVYAEVDRFHGSVEAISTLLCERAGNRPEEVLPHLYVHYDDGAVSHLFGVASGLDSMVVGESQVLGQVREALRLGQEQGGVGTALNSLFQQALRVGKRVHAETDIDRAAPSVVSAALERAVAHVGSLDDKTVLVVGAGSMAGLAMATVARNGVGTLVVANRTPERAHRLAAQYDARALSLDELPDALPDADVLISCTGAVGVIIDAARLERPDRTEPRAVVDLALPHDVDPAVAMLPGVRLIDLAGLAADLEATPRHDGETGSVAAVRGIVTQELAAFLSARHAASVTPTVVALRTMATDVVEAELDRLSGRLPGLDDEARAEVAQTVRRVADKLLHQPTVRVKELASAQGAVSYTAALAELFSLDPQAVEAVTRADTP